MKVKNHFADKMTLGEWIYCISNSCKVRMEDGNVQLVPIEDNE